MIRTEPREIENRMIVDSEWGETEYGVPSKHRMNSERQAYEDAEREDRENEYII